MKMRLFADAIQALPMVYKNHFKNQQAVTDFMTGGANADELIFIFHKDAPEAFIVFRWDEEDSVEAFMEQEQEWFDNVQNGDERLHEDTGAIVPVYDWNDEANYIIKTASQIVREGVPTFGTPTEV